MQSAGAAVSFGMDAVKTRYLTELLVSWLMTLLSLIPCAYVLWNIPESMHGIERVIHVEDVEDKQLQGAAVPSGHHTHEQAYGAAEMEDAEKKGAYADTRTAEA